MERKGAHKKWYKHIFRYVTNMFWTIICFLYALAIAGSLLPSWAGVPFAPFTTIFPLLIPLLIYVIIITIIKKNKRFIIISLLLLLISFPMIWSICPLNFGVKPPAANDNIKILSYNVNVFRMDRRHEPTMPSHILQFIHKQNPDIVCLQEATLQRTIRNGLTMNEVINQMKDLYPYIQKNMAQVNHGSNLMILSKYPILSSYHLNLKSFVNGGMAYKLEIKGKEVLLINLHLESYRLNMKYESRRNSSLNHVESTLHKMLRAFKNAHFIKAYFLRNNQADEVIRFIKKQSMQGRVIVCGDFNATPMSYPVMHMGHYLQNCYTKTALGPGISFRSAFFIVRIDNIFCGNAFKPIYTEVYHKIYDSDHYPIISYITPKW